MGKALVLVVALMGSAGCVTTFSSAAVQPNPLVIKDKTLLPTSAQITIVTGDMELNAQAPAILTESQAHYYRWPLYNTASWTMVGKDELRFHVQVDHKWEEYADITAWSAVLEDDQGHRYAPEAIEEVRKQIIMSTWDQGQRTTVCADRTADGYCNDDAEFDVGSRKERLGFATLQVYRGNADLVFEQPNLMTPSIRWLKLTLKHGTESFQYQWKFDTNVASR
jgi:hypothetical protein